MHKAIRKRYITYDANTEPLKTYYHDSYYMFITMKDIKLKNLICFEVERIKSKKEEEKKYTGVRDEFSYKSEYFNNKNMKYEYCVIRKIVLTVYIDNEIYAIEETYHIDIFDKLNTKVQVKHIGNMNVLYRENPDKYKLTKVL